MWGSGGIVPSFVTSALDGNEWSASSPGRFTPDKEPLISIVYEIQWAPQPIWELWRKFFASWNSNPGRPTRNRSLYRLSYPDLYEVVIVIVNNLTSSIF
jgi:hypothetical protein